jgi:hypothetical protein
MNGYFEILKGEVQKLRRRERKKLIIVKTEARWPHTLHDHIRTIKTI